MNGGRYVEMAVCDNCRRVFHAASMRGALCISCAAKAAPSKASEPPEGFVQAVCPDCGGTFSRPRSANRAVYCWNCADKRRRKAERLRKRRRAEIPAVYEDAVCPDCGKTFQRSRAGSGRIQTYCHECAGRRRKESNRLRFRRYAARKAANRPTD